jgi:hypothetical protein
LYKIKLILALYLIYSSVGKWISTFQTTKDCGKKSQKSVKEWNFIKKNLSSIETCTFKRPAKTLMGGCRAVHPTIPRSQWNAILLLLPIRQIAEKMLQVIKRY